MSFPTQQVRPFGSGFDRLLIGFGDDGHAVEMAALAQIATNLPEEIDRQQQSWVQRQQDFNNAMGFASRPISVPQVDQKNFYVGARPSLVSSPIEFWPSITARCGDARPSRQQEDHFDDFDLDLYVEIMCYSGPVARERLHMDEGIAAEGDVNAQIHLLSGAVQLCVSRDRTLGGVVQTIQNPPTIRPGMPFSAPGVDQERTGDYFIYAGRQHRYVVNRMSY
jgi:hypothetical protein